MDCENRSSLPILHIVVVGFHHKRGCQVDFSYPAFFKEKGCESRDVPEQWKHLPFLALPDGAHNYDQDTIYFHLPGLQDAKHTVYGVSCYMQINSKELINKSNDVTRGTVQKSVVVLSHLPLFGLIHAKLQLITHAYFAQKDFTKVQILQEFYSNLNRSLPSTMPKSGDAQAFIGLSVIELIKIFKHKILVLFKLLLLERRVLFYGTPVHHLCNTLLTVISLFPDMIERGLIDAACPRYYRAKTPNFELGDFGIHTDDYLEVDTSSLPNYRKQQKPRNDDSHAWKTMSLPSSQPVSEKRFLRIERMRKERAKQMNQLGEEIREMERGKRDNKEEGFDDVLLEDGQLKEPAPSEGLDLDENKKCSDVQDKGGGSDVHKDTPLISDSLEESAVLNNESNEGGAVQCGTEEGTRSKAPCSSELVQGVNGVTLSPAERSAVTKSEKIEKEQKDSIQEELVKTRLKSEEDDILDLIDQELFGPYFEEKKERIKHNSGKGSTCSDLSGDQSHDQSAILDVAGSEGLKPRKDSGYSSKQSIHEKDSLCTEKEGDASNDRGLHGGLPQDRGGSDRTPYKSLDKTRPSSLDDFVVLPKMPGTPGVDVDDFGFPLALFGKGALCHPYMALQQHDLLQEVSVRCFIVGASNMLFKHKRHILDVIVELESGNVNIFDPDLRKQLNLSTADLRFADHVVNTVLERYDDQFDDNTAWEGGEAWIRSQFRQYLLSLLATCADDRPKADEVWGDFNENFLNAWRTTHNYRIWRSRQHQGIDQIHTRHVCHGQLSMNDMKIRINSAMQNTERGRKLNNALNRTSTAMASTGKVMGDALSNAKSVVSSWFLGLAPDEWSDEED